MRKLIALTAASTVVAGLLATAAIPAFASSSDDDYRCGQVAADQWMSVADITAKVEALGYTVRKVERDDGCYEVYGTNKNGTRYELKLHPATGEVVKLERD
ncbi:hypothetical protein MNBD_ALPHA09-1986 [hydrothermal vent metagenome]|uniref:PepSY domain-containing protein n=1 Tax=hydrothermal vent metagenome TaxID=652676 RepID=A0A3B0TRC8_9ZZZZ